MHWVVSSKVKGVIAALLALSVLALGQREGYAQQGFAQAGPVAPGGVRAAKVVLAPHFLFLDGQVTPAMEGQAQPEASSEGQPSDRAHRAVERYIASGGGQTLALVPAEQAQEALLGQRLYADRLELAEQFAQQGIQSYKELNQALATRSLEKALEQYEAIRYDLIAPRRVAQVLLYLALSYVEQDAKLPQALRAIRQMILLDPSLVLRRGYDADKIVDLYEDARRTLLDELKLRGPRLEQLEQAREFARLVGADYVLYGVVIPKDDGGGYTLSLYAYNSAEGRFELGESGALERLDAATVEDAADRAISRWVSCKIEPEGAEAGPPRSRGRGALSVSLGVSYMSFFKNPRPLEDLFGNYGLGLGARWLITREFGVVGGAQLLIAQRDRSGRIVDEDFPTFRGFVGGELGFELFDDLTLAIQLSGDITHVSTFEVWGDANCIPREDCAEGPVVFDGYGLMLGVNTRPSVSYQLHEALSAQLAANFSYFFYTGQGADLNFPLGADLGLQYRF